MNKVLLALGAPVWMPLLIAFFAVIFSVLVSVWAVVLALWAAPVALATGAVAGAVGGNILAFSGHWLTGIAMAGAAFFCAGMAILTFFAGKGAFKAAFWFTRMTLLGVSRCFSGGKAREY